MNDPRRWFCVGEVLAVVLGEEFVDEEEDKKE